MSKEISILRNTLDRTEALINSLGIGKATLILTAVHEIQEATSDLAYTDTITALDFCKETLVEAKAIYTKEPK